MIENKIKGMAGSIPVFCAFDEILPTEEIRPNPKNPNQHPGSQVELLAKIITKQGWRAPVTVSTRSGLVVRRPRTFDGRAVCGLLPCTR